MERCVHIFFSGKVQGVGFRYTSYRLANKHNIKGWVMNLDDGRVELLAQGKRDDLDRFLNELNIEFQGYIRDYKMEEIVPKKDLVGFNIRFY